MKQILKHLSRLWRRLTSKPPAEVYISHSVQGTSRVPEGNGMFLYHFLQELGMRVLDEHIFFEPEERNQLFLENTGTDLSKLDLDGQAKAITNWDLKWVQQTYYLILLDCSSVGAGIEVGFALGTSRFRRVLVLVHDSQLSSVSRLMYGLQGAFPRRCRVVVYTDEGELARAAMNFLHIK